MMCKPWKMNGVSVQSQEGESKSDHVRRHADDGATKGKAYQKGKKRFGIHLIYSGMFKTWQDEDYSQWYHTERGRDDAYRVVERRPKSSFRSLLELSKVER